MSTEQEGASPQEPEQATESEPASQEPAAAATDSTTAAEAGRPAAAPKAPRSRAKAAAAEPAPEDAAEPAAAEAPAQKTRAKAPAAGKTAADKTAAGKTATGKATAGKAAAPKAAKAPSTPARSRVVVTDLPADIFDAKVNIPLIHQVVVAQQAAARQGTHATKTRGDVRGGGKKPYRQKGTGRARQGSTRAPQFAGGGVVHGPVPRSYEQRTPKKMKAAALRGALSDRARHGFVHVVDGFVDGDVPKTRDALSVLTAVTGPANGTTSVLVVVTRADQVTWKSLRNVPGVHLIDPGQLSSYDVLVSDRVVFTDSALESFVARAGAASQQEGE